MGGGSDTNITNTGLGDDQFANLSAGQSSINSNINATRDGTNARFDSVDGTLSGIRGDISGVGTNLTSGFTNLQDLMGQNMEANQQGFTGVTNSIDQSTGQIQSGMQTGFDGVNQNLTTGFGTMDERFNRVDNAQQTAQTSIDTGFQDTSNNFSDLDIRLNDDFNAAQQTMAGGFADVGQGLTDLDTSTQNRLDTVQGNVLTGQSILDQGITGMSDAQDIYYNDLSGRQMEIQQGQDGFQSTFDDYVQRYSDDVTLANQTRNDLQTGLVNSTSRIREDFGRFGQTLSEGQGDLAGRISAADQNTQLNFDRLASDVVGGFNDQRAQIGSVQGQLLSEMDAQAVVEARDMARIASSQTDLDMQTRADFRQLSDAFDDTGRLISSSIDAQGNTLTRQIDENGNMLLRSFDVTGRAIDGRVLDINRALNTLNNLDFQAGGNVSMGNLSPAMTGAVPNSGFASPFTATR